MDRGGRRRAGPFADELVRWREVGGGIDSDGNTVVKPPELEYAELILGLCREFKKLPSEVEAESVEFLRLLQIERLGSRREQRSVPDEDWGEVEY